MTGRSVNIGPPGLSFFCLAGPTAVGKSEFALRLAEVCDAEIVGADAFQIYRGMDLLTAKPSAADRARIPHHLIDYVPRTETFDVARYLADATAAIAEIQARGKLPLVVGGTGLYFRALTRGLSPLPGPDPQLRAELEAKELPELQAQLSNLDPAGAAVIDLKNKRRVVRAIEVSMLTGKPFSSFRVEWEKTPVGEGVLLVRERAELNRRIDARVVEMFENGLLEEVAGLGPLSATAAQAIGIAPVRTCLSGEISREECCRQIQIATRQYAKRQLTWFRREPMFSTVDLTIEFESLLPALAERIQHRKESRV